MVEKQSFDEKELLAWMAGLTITRPLSSALTGLREKGLVTDGDVMSAELTEKGCEIVAGWRNG